MTQSSTPFADIRALVAGMPGLDAEMQSLVATGLGLEADPLRCIGDLDAPVAWLAAWQSRMTPTIERPLVAVFVGSHGVAETVLGEDAVAGAQARVKLMAEGAAGVRAVAASYQAAFKVFELGIEYPSADMSKEPSLSERDCAAAIAFGMEVVAEGADIIVLGNAGFGSATAAAGIAQGLYGGQTEYWAGGNTEVAPRRVAAVAAAAKLHGKFLPDPLEVLRCFGGRDIAGMVGAILAARHQRIPVLLDGFVSCAAAAILHKIDPNSLDHCYASHASSEPAHKALLDRLSLTPILDLGIGVGDGTGGAFALGALKAAASVAAYMLEEA